MLLLPLLYYIIIIIIIIIINNNNNNNHVYHLSATRFSASPLLKSYRSSRGRTSGSLSPDVGRLSGFGTRQISVQPSCD